jgi:hypothetical protein
MDLRSRRITPDKPSKSHCDTPEKQQFYDAFDNKDVRGYMPARHLFTQLEVPKTTAYRWLNNRELYGSIASRRKQLRDLKQRETDSPGSGRPLTISTAQLQQLIHSDKDQREKRLKTQIQDAGITAGIRTVQRALLTRCNACMYKAAVMAEITPLQQDARVEYTRERCFYRIEGYWDGIIYTDEAHMSLDDYPRTWILRVFGERHHAKNIEKQSNLTAACVHFASWINYYTRANELTFYNDEYDDYVAPTPPPKPRRRPTTETEDAYKERVARWEAEKARIPEIIKPGNSMRASYYVDKILPIYRDALLHLRARSDELRSEVSPDIRYKWYIVEDNDPSHGTRN